MLNKLILNLKNSFGWTTDRKIVVFSVDDYGNVRVDSKKAREEMDKKGGKVVSRFDQFDALEDPDDLTALYEALSSVNDKNGKPAVFTAFAVPANINFEKIKESGYREYHYELLPATFSRLRGYSQMPALWQEGIDKHLLIPQYHGREHLNLKVFMEALTKNDPATMLALEHQSYAGIESSGYDSISYTAAFDFWDIEENQNLMEIAADGIEAFKASFGVYPVHFNAPGNCEHPLLHEILQSKGIKYIDAPLLKKEHLGYGKYRWVINYTGKKNKHGQLFQVRNCVFEPSDNRGFDWVDYTLKQVEIAFRWNKPAIISSHRVNFSGHIEPKNRKEGITTLKQLLKQIVQRWPDVEFMAANELGDLVAKAQKHSYS